MLSVIPCSNVFAHRDVGESGGYVHSYRHKEFLLVTLEVVLWYT